jgi:hypothetical protein
VIASGCGGDDPEPEAAVVWFNISQMSSGNCDRAYNFQLPAGTAADTIRGQISGTPRLEDGKGGNVVDCSVRATATPGAFQVALQLRSTEIRNFQASGTLSKGVGTVRISLQSDRTGALGQSDCEAEVEVISDGAVWIRSLRCDSLTDELSTNTLCLGAGGVLFERCQG